MTQRWDWEWLPGSARLAELGTEMRAQAGRIATDSAWRLLARATGLLPLARPEWHGVERVTDVPYRRTGLAEHLLDVYRPRNPSGRPPLVLYAHGGGFRILSKDSHWVMALAFARRGYVVATFNYRLAPRHRFPAAIEDACAALLWGRENAESLGADPERIVLAGESAGANLATSLAIAAAYRRDEPFARAVFDAGIRPRAVVPTCGLLQVSDVSRFVRRKRLPPFVRDRLLEVEHAYLGPSAGPPPDGPELDLANPLLVLERGRPPERPLPPFYAAVGTRDPLLDDTRRLGAALERLGVPCEIGYFPGEIHAFHAFLWRRHARACWGATFAFLDRHAPALAAPAS